MKRFVMNLVFASLILRPCGSLAAVVATNLVTDDQNIHPAFIEDSSLKNGWGVSYAPGGPFWISANGTGTSVVYNVSSATNVPSVVPLVVTIPGDGSVTGQVSNTTADFNGDSFLFVSEDGTVSGWRGALGTTAENIVLASPNNTYKGAALATIGANTYLYAANFKSSHVDVYKGNAGAPTLAGTFTDPTLPAGYAPFNIQNLGGTLYVAYAQPDATGHDDVPGAGHGFVDAFDVNGNFLSRIATQGALDSPWGLAIAPAGFENVGGDLLIGNFGDGTINAFNLTTHASDGPLKNLANAPLVIGGLWALVVGNGGFAGSADRVFFSAGPNDESHGLFGSLTSVPEPSAVATMFIAGGVLTNLWRGRRRSE
jgi:uncharacterized protein (TIGR03118 family)